MRVALVVERFEPDKGGVENVVWNVARELVRCGDEPHVFARVAAESPGVAVHRLSVPAFWQPIRVSEFARQSRRALESHSWDAVHSFSRTLHQDIFHAGGGSHADYMLETYGRSGAALRRATPRHALLLALERRIFADPKQTIQCVSQMVRREIAARFATPESRLRVVPCGVDIARFDPGENAQYREPLRNELDAKDAVIWLLAGSGWRRKGLDTALAALAMTDDRRTQLWVAGNDDPRAWRAAAEERGVGDRVRFIGNRGDLERWLSAADGLLLPTRYDAFGMVCLEAAAAGRPIITSGRAGAAELLTGAAEVVARPGDVRGFAKAMDALADPGRRGALGEAGLGIARSHGWPSQVEKLRGLYREHGS